MSLHTQQDGQEGVHCPAISEDEILSQIVGSHYKCRIYGMWTYYSGSSIPFTSMIGLFAMDNELTNIIK